MKLVLLAATALIAAPVFAQTADQRSSTTMGAGSTPSSSMPAATQQQGDPAMQSQGDGAMQPQADGSMPPQPMATDPAMQSQSPAAGTMTPGGYAPSQAPMSGTMTPGAPVSYQQAPSPSQAFPPPPAKASYPPCKKGQYDGCTQKGGR